VCVVYVFCMCYVRVPHGILACVWGGKREREGTPRRNPVRCFEFLRVGGWVGVCVGVWVRESEDMSNIGMSNVPRRHKSCLSYECVSHSLSYE